MSTDGDRHSHGEDHRFESVLEPLAGKGKSVAQEPPPPRPQSKIVRQPKDRIPPTLVLCHGYEHYVHPGTKICPFCGGDVRALMRRHEKREARITAAAEPLRDRWRITCRRDRSADVGDHLKTIADHLNVIADHLKVIWDHLKVIWDHLKVIWDHLKVIADHLKAIRDHLKVIRGHLRDGSARSAAVESETLSGQPARRRRSAALT